MHTLDYTMLVASGFIGFLLGAIGSGACYFAASFVARLIASKRLWIYFARLIFLVVFAVIWWLCVRQVVLWHRMGDGLQPEFWYRLARQDGVGCGFLSLLGWFIVALIDLPKDKTSQKPPNTALEPTPTAP